MSVDAPSELEMKALLYLAQRPGRVYLDWFDQDMAKESGGDMRTGAELQRALIAKGWAWIKRSAMGPKILLTDAGKAMVAEAHVPTGAMAAADLSVVRKR